MRFLLHLYKEEKIALGIVPTKEQFDEILAEIAIDDEYFITDNYSPGTAGESRLLKDLINGEPLDT
jgi:hypothetical protein